ILPKTESPVSEPGDTPKSIDGELFEGDLFSEEFTKEPAPYEMYDDLVTRASSRPWKSSEIPPLAKWISDNQESIDLLVAASKRPKFYTPILGSSENTLLIN